MRHRATREVSEPSRDAIAGLAKIARIDSVELIATVLLVLLSASSAVADSEPFDLAMNIQPEMTPPPPAAPVPEATELSLRTSFSVPVPGSSASDAVAIDRELILPSMRQPNLAALLAVHSGGDESRSDKTTDEALLDAIALGPRPDLQPKRPFRNRKLDLLKSERPVSIGRADMLVRFRLRGKIREAMSFEVRF